MKKTISLLLALIMVAAMCLSLAACGSTPAANNTANNSAEPKPATDLDKIKSKGKLVVGVTDYAPFDYEEGGQWVGFDADMARLLGEKIGLPVEFILIDWEQKITELKSGAIDLIWNGMTMTEDLAKEMDFSVPYAQNSQVIVVKADKADSIKSIEDVKGMKVVAEGGSAGEDAAVEAFGSNVTGLPGQTKALFEVKAGTADAAVVDYSIAKSLCGTGDYADLKMVEGIKIGEELFAVGARKGSDIVVLLDELFKESSANGKMAELQEKYGKQDDGSNSIALCEIK